MPSKQAKTTHFRPIVTLVGLLLFAGMVAYRLWPASDPPVPRAAVFEGAAMGTTWRVKIAAAGLAGQRGDEAGRAIAAAIEDVEVLMSTWRQDSELSIFNADRSSFPHRLSRETIAVLMTAKQVFDLSGGAFDPTVGPLVDAWGFGAGDAIAQPTPEDITRLKLAVGLQRLEIDESGGKATKHLPELSCDLSGIAKGFGADRVAVALEKLGLSDFMVEIGGEIAVRGGNERGEPWRIAVERPSDGEVGVFLVLALTDLAVATSGDYRNYREENGKRLSHTIDPRTGYPVDHRLASVTVVHESCTVADAMATALTVLGPEAGMALARREKLAAHFIVRAEDGGFESRATDEFSALIAPGAGEEDKE